MKSDQKNEPGRMEAWLSIGLLVVLSIAGAGVTLRQFHFNPAVLSMRSEYHPDSILAERGQDALIDTEGTNVMPFSPPERFGPENLYEKINGRADFYLAADFISLQTQRFTTPKLEGAWVEVFIYDMGRPDNAFSVFSMQRRTDGSVEQNSVNAYHTENALFMTHGNFYLELIGTDASVEGTRVRALLADRFKGAHSNTSDESLNGAALFPTEGFDPGSLQLIPADAFGQEPLDRVYTGEYSIDGIRATAFVSVREDAEEALTVAKAYQSALLSFGADVVDSDTGIAGAAVIQMFDTYEIIFNQGNLLGGVHESNDLDTAIRLAKELSDHLAGHLDESIKEAK